MIDYFTSWFYWERGDLESSRKYHDAWFEARVKNVTPSNDRAAAAWKVNKARSCIILGLIDLGEGGWTRPNPVWLR